MNPLIATVLTLFTVSAIPEPTPTAAFALAPAQARSDVHLLGPWLHGRARHTARCYRRVTGSFLAALKPAGLRGATLGYLQAWASALGGAEGSWQVAVAVVKSLGLRWHDLAERGADRGQLTVFGKGARRDASCCRRPRGGSWSPPGRLATSKSRRLPVEALGHPPGRPLGLVAGGGRHGAERRGPIFPRGCPRTGCGTPTPRTPRSTAGPALPWCRKAWGTPAPPSPASRYVHAHLDDSSALHLDY